MGYCLAVLSLAKLGKRRYLPANRLSSAALPALQCNPQEGRATEMFVL